MVKRNEIDGRLDINGQAWEPFLQRDPASTVYGPVDLAEPGLPEALGEQPGSILTVMAFFPLTSRP